MAFLALLHWCEGNRFRLIDCFSVLPVFPKFLWNWKLPLGSLIQLVPFLISLPTFYFLVCTFLWKKNEQCWPQHQSFEWTLHSLDCGCMYMKFGYVHRYFLYLCCLGLFPFTKREGWRQGVVFQCVNTLKYIQAYMQPFTFSHWILAIIVWQSVVFCFLNGASGKRCLNLWNTCASF